MSDMMLFEGELNLPTYLQGVGLGVGTDLMAVIGDSRNRIGLKGNRFRQIIQGQEVGVWDENYLDVIIVGVVLTLSRIFYAAKYKQGDSAAPTCYSADNIVPNDDVIQKQSDKCMTCPQNVKGSKVSEDGHEGKACSYFRRMAILLPGDSTLYYIDVKAMGLFGPSKEEINKRNLNDYAKFLNTKKVDASIIVTRLSFDTSESVPKLLFQPLRPINESEAMTVMQLGQTNEVAEYLTINMKTVDISNEVSAEEVVPAAAPAAVTRPQPAPVAQPVQTQQAPKAAPKPVQVAPKPVAAKPVAVAPKPVQAAPKPAPVVIHDNVPQPEIVETSEDLDKLLEGLDL